MHPSSNVYWSPICQVVVWDLCGIHTWISHNSLPLRDLVAWVINRGYSGDDNKDNIILTFVNLWFEVYSFWHYCPSFLICTLPVLLWGWCEKRDVKASGNSKCHEPGYYYHLYCFSQSWIRIITNVSEITTPIFMKAGQEFPSLPPFLIKPWMQIVLNP